MLKQSKQTSLSNAFETHRSSVMWVKPIYAGGAFKNVYTSSCKAILTKNGMT